MSCHFLNPTSEVILALACICKLTPDTLLLTWAFCVTGSPASASEAEQLPAPVLRGIAISCLASHDL